MEAANVAEVFGFHEILMMFGGLWRFLHSSPHQTSIHFFEIQCIGKRENQPVFILPGIAFEFRCCDQIGQGPARVAPSLSW